MSSSILSILRFLIISLMLLCTCDALPLHKYSHLAKRLSHLHFHKKSEEIKPRQTLAAFGLGIKVAKALSYWGNTNTNEGIAYSTDSYTYYSGGPENFPSTKNWMSFEAMFQANIPLMKQSCGWNGWGPDNTNRQIGYMKTYIQQVARASRVDQRAILAVIMQESAGCLRAPTTSNGVTNPGLMQSHNGVAFDPSRPVTTIKQMIVDGTMGTAYGDGLVQLINQYGNYYKAFRAYNSGSIAPDGDLSNGNGATPCYVSDIANRLTGWTLAPNACRGGH
ncbi:hypothetical protein AOL_s00054g271 [Orbilia oligospora ATCC 24927]|uniref:Transglycosylase SLT domain-containing protein n=1 Tax=Arthrobotrys oligospora (strain ATCC 24927 / CBS 115.81 / DSM 1491) TaxID=756982 RepID=G1X5X7_ARTOA|nr:hypothetical protein AOL_s00054g271 [Orbilia oligospora ATCC 24927]EGX51572.1 hypothetical protein AOL_s00054g271 [Orbilia oligospora ATCC 24927]